MFTAGLENIFLLWPSGNILSHFSSCHTCLSFLVWSPPPPWSLMVACPGLSLRSFLCFSSAPWGLTQSHDLRDHLYSDNLQIDMSGPDLLGTSTWVSEKHLKHNRSQGGLLFPLPQLLLQWSSRLSERQIHSFSSSGQAARSQFFPVSLSPHQSILLINLQKYLF